MNMLRISKIFLYKAILFLALFGWEKKAKGKKVKGKIVKGKKIR